MRVIYITIISLFCIVLVSCTAEHGFLPVQEQSAKLNDSNNQLRKGRELAITECAECHRLYPPEEYTSEEWDRVIKEKSQRLSLRKDQIDALDFYFKTKSGTSE